jgi:hypothetical protein
LRRSREVGGRQGARMGLRLSSVRVRETVRIGAMATGTGELMVSMMVFERGPVGAWLWLARLIRCVVWLLNAALV